MPVLHPDGLVEQQAVRHRGHHLRRRRFPGQRAGDALRPGADVEDDEDADRDQPHHEEALEDPADEETSHVNS
jgi:hypothetical protein